MISNYCSGRFVVAALLILFYLFEECRKFLVEANDSNSNSLVIGRYDFTGESLRPIKDAEFTLSTFLDSCAVCTSC